MPQVGAVHPDLVGAAGIQLETQEGVVAQPLHQAPVGAGVAARVVVDYGVFLAVGWVAADGGHDRAGIARRHPVHYRQILARGDPLLDLHLQLHQRLLALGHHDAARRVLVEPVHDAGPQLPADAGQVGAMVQQALNQGAIPVAGRRMHGEPGGLIEHDQVGVFVEHIQGHGLGQQIGQGLRRRHPQRHAVALAQGGLGPAGDPIDPHIAGLDELLDPGPTLLRPLGHQPAIQPHRQGLGVGEGD